MPTPPTGGRRGRPRKPTPLRVLEGNRGKRKVPAEPAPARGPTDPPPHLSPAAREVWLRLAPELRANGLLAPRYTDSFFFLCEAVVAGQKAAAVLAAAGPLVTREGQVVSNPASREFARYAVLVRGFANDFGLSPAAVTALARGEAPGEPGGPLRLLT